MAQVLVRNIPEEVVARLKKRAAAQGRSLQAELRQILIDGAGSDFRQVRLLAARIRKRLGGRIHSDSARLLAEDRER
jgi:antitoxin FitA